MLHVYIGLRMKTEKGMTCVSSGHGGTNFDINDGKWQHIVFTIEQKTSNQTNLVLFLHSDTIKQIMKICLHWTKTRNYSNSLKPDEKYVVYLFFDSGTAGSTYRVFS